MPVDHDAIRARWGKSVGTATRDCRDDIRTLLDENERLWQQLRNADHDSDCHRVASESRGEVADEWMKRAEQAERERDALKARVAELEAEALWVRCKLGLEPDTPANSGKSEPTVFGAMHVVCSQSKSWTNHCKEFAEVKEVKRELAAARAEVERLREMVARLETAVDEEQKKAEGYWRDLDHARAGEIKAERERDEARADREDIVRRSQHVSERNAELEHERDEARALLERIRAWTLIHGSALKPPVGCADSFGEGMREAKRQIAALGGE